MTENPIVIMLINMTIVFAVLALLNVFLRVIHMIDPTFKKPEPAPKAVVTAPAPVPAPVVEPGISPETVAAIAGALAAYGVGFSQIKAIRPIDRNGWKNAGRNEGINKI